MQKLPQISLQFLTLMLLVFSLAVGPTTCQAKISQTTSTTSWTTLIYAGVDSSSEGHILPHLTALAELSKIQQQGKIVLFIDRASGHSDDDKVFGENFDDARLYELKAGEWIRLAGSPEFPEITIDSDFEANSGSPETLRKFIQFGKRHAPADKFALIIFGHGECRFVCPDESSPNPKRNEADDPLYVSEITEHIESDCSVDFLWMDVCSFGSIENAYQLRPGTGRFSASVMLASPPVSTPLPMADILNHVGILGEQSEEKSLPSNANQFGSLAFEQTRDHLKKRFFHGYREVWGLYDLTAVEKVKTAMDKLACSLSELDSKPMLTALRGTGRKPPTLNYMRSRKDESLMWLVAPNFDLFDLAQRISASTDFNKQVTKNAEEVEAAVDELILDSVAGGAYPKFQAGQNGIYVVFPDGEKIWRDQPHWQYFQWYCPNDRSEVRYSYGKYAWSSDGAQPGNRKVENWFELLDSWYDNNDANGGLNEYKW